MKNFQKMHVVRHRGGGWYCTNIIELFIVNILICTRPSRSNQSYSQKILLEVHIDESMLYWFGTNNTHVLLYQ